MTGWGEHPASELHVGAHVLEGETRVLVCTYLAHYQGRVVAQFRCGEARTFEPTELLWMSRREAA